MSNNQEASPLHCVAYFDVFYALLTFSLKYGNTWEGGEREGYINLHDSSFLALPYPFSPTGSVSSLTSSLSPARQPPYVCSEAVTTAVQAALPADTMFRDPGQLFLSKDSWSTFLCPLATRIAPNMAGKSSQNHSWFQEALSHDTNAPFVPLSPPWSQGGLLSTSCIWARAESMLSALCLHSQVAPPDQCSWMPG